MVNVGVLTNVIDGWVAIAISCPQPARLVRTIRTNDGASPALGVDIRAALLGAPATHTRHFDYLSISAGGFTCSSQDGGWVDDENASRQHQRQSCEIQRVYAFHGGLQRSVLIASARAKEREAGPTKCEGRVSNRGKRPDGICVRRLLSRTITPERPRY